MSAFLCGSVAKFAPLREHSRKSMRSISVDILEILPHLVHIAIVTPQDMRLLRWYHVPGNKADKDPREIVVTGYRTGPVLLAFQVGGKIRARNRPIDVSFDATTLELFNHVCLPDDPICITQPQRVVQLYSLKNDLSFIICFMPASGSERANAFFSSRVPGAVAVLWPLAG